MTDPFALEVHRPVQVDDSPPNLTALPDYVSRQHDQTLAEVVRTAAAGNSGIAVLVGGSSTGKTRACWEALELLRNLPQPWRLWHPIDPSRPEAALHELPSIGARTVVWLNEAQFYLDASGGLGERVAAGLRELLRDPSNGPVLVLATLWPEFWDILTARPPVDQADPHAQARELLSGRDISVPAVFTAAQVQMLVEAIDPRLAMAAAARDGQVVQFLAGAPELLARYRYAPSAAAALVSAAIDGRRLGMGVALPIGFLETAAPGYLTEDQWDRLDEDWLDQALDYAAADSKGTRGMLTRIRPRPSPGDALALTGPVCRLADYLDQNGRQSRRSIIPPAQFWAAVGLFAAPSDLSALARAAESRGLLRDAARLRKRAVAYGDTRAAAALITSLHSLHLADSESARWASTNAALEDAGAVAWLLWALRKAGAADQAAVLLGRDPAAHASLGDPHAIVRLLRELRRAGAADQAAALTTRAAAHTNLGDVYAIVRLLKALGTARAYDQIAVLATRAAAGIELDDPRAVAQLLRALQDVNAADQTAVLLARNPAVHADLENSRGVARLLKELQEVGAADQTTILIARAAVHASFDDPTAVARLLQELRRAGAADQTAALLTRDPAAHINLKDPESVARLLQALRDAGAADQTAALLARSPAARASLEDPGAVARLLLAFLRNNASGQAAALLTRDPAAHINLKDPESVARLLKALQEAGAADQAAALLTRDPAAHINLEDPRGVASLLETLRRMGAAQQVRTLAIRTAAYVRLEDPGAVASLLWVLRRNDAADQTAVLLARDPAAHVNLEAPDGITRLLRALYGIGAVSQAEALTERLATEGLFDLFCKQAGNQETYAFGREPDGSAANPWGWDDLD